LPKNHREKQSDWFGKAGIPWFGATACLIGTDGTMEVHYFNQVYQNRDKGWVATAGLLANTFFMIRRQFPHLKKLKLWADNAGNFTAGDLLYHLEGVAGLSDMSLISFQHNEAFCGKTCLDAHFGLVKQLIRL
jgi:hypothetical protein